MANRYERITLVARKLDGAVAPGAEIAVYVKSTGALAALYVGDNLSGGSVSNPVFASSSGTVSFYAGDLKENYTFTPVDSSVVVATEATVDTTENHRQTGEHAAGTITSDQLAFTIEPGSDVSIHAALEANTHGLGATEHFAHTKAGTAAGATDSPDFANLLSDTFSTAQFLGCTVVEDPSGTGLATAISAASNGDTLLIPAGVHTLSASVNPANLHLVGMGPDCELKLASGSNPVINYTTAAGFPRALRNLTIRHEGTGHAVAFTSMNNALIDNCRLIAASGNALDISGNTDFVRVTNSELSSTSGSGFKMNATTPLGPFILHATNIAGGGLALELTAPTTNAYGGTISCCDIEGDSTISIPRVRCLGNVFEGNITMASTASTGLLPENGNVITGTLTNSVYAGPFQQWDYISSWIDIDNSAASKTDEYFLAGTSGIGSGIAHNLGSRQLDVKVEVANNSTGSDERWPVYPSTHGAANDDVVPGSNHMSVHVINGNTINLVMYAGDHQDGSGSTAGVAKTIWAATDSQALQTADSKSYVYDSAGGYALDRVWIRVFIRRSFG